MKSYSLIKSFSEILCGWQRWSVQQFAPDSLNNYWIDCYEICPDICRSQRMNPTDFRDIPMFHLVPPAGRRFDLHSQVAWCLSRLSRWYKTSNNNKSDQWRLLLATRRTQRICCQHPGARHHRTSPRVESTWIRHFLVWFGSGEFGGQFSSLSSLSRSLVWLGGAWMVRTQGFPAEQCIVTQITVLSVLMRFSVLNFQCTELRWSISVSSFRSLPFPSASALLTTVIHSFPARYPCPGHDGSKVGKVVQMILSPARFSSSSWAGDPGWEIYSLQMFWIYLRVTYGPVVLGKLSEEATQRVSSSDAGITSRLAWRSSIPLLSSLQISEHLRVSPVTWKLILCIVSFFLSPAAFDHRWELECRTTGKTKALPSGSAPSSSRCPSTMARLWLVPQQSAISS